MAKETISGGNTQQAWTAENPFFNYGAQSNDAIREVWGWQVKAGQAFVEQSMKMSQVLADFAHNQLQESTRLSQECMKHTVSATDEARRSLFDLADRVVKKN